MSEVLERTGSLKSLIMGVETPAQAQQIDTLLVKEFSEDAPFTALAYANLVAFQAALFCMAGLSPRAGILYVFSSFLLIIFGLIVSLVITPKRAHLKLVSLVIILNEICLISLLLFNYYAETQANNLFVIPAIVSFSFISISLCARFMLPFVFIKLIAIIACCIYVYLDQSQNFGPLLMFAIISVCLLMIASIGYWLIKRKREEVWLRSQLTTMNAQAVERNIRLDKALADTEAAQKRINEDFDLRQKLLSYIGHDLRQPVNAAGLILRELSRKEDAPDKADLINNTNACVQSVKRMIEDMLQLTHYNNSNIEVMTEDLQLDTVFRKILQEYTESAARAGYEIRYTPTKEKVHFDSFLLTRIVGNLIQNAIHHAHGSVIELEVQPGETAVEIRVTDNGRGFDQKASAGSSGSKSDLPNLGLGLVISEQLAAACGADLIIESTPGKGTCGRLIIPRAGPA